MRICILLWDWCYLLIPGKNNDNDDDPGPWWNLPLIYTYRRRHRCKQYFLLLRESSFCVKNGPRLTHTVSMLSSLGFLVLLNLKTRLEIPGKKRNHKQRRSAEKNTKETENKKYRNKCEPRDNALPAHPFFARTPRSVPVIWTLRNGNRVEYYEIRDNNKDKSPQLDLIYIYSWSQSPHSLIHPRAVAAHPCGLDHSLVSIHIHRQPEATSQNPESRNTDTLDCLRISRQLSGHKMWKVRAGMPSGALRSPAYYYVIQSAQLVVKLRAFCHV